MQTILTRYLGATNHRPSRIVAQCQAGRISLAWEHGESVQNNHRAACEALRAKLGWTKVNNYPAMIGGETATGYVWIYTSEQTTTN